VDEKTHARARRTRVPLAAFALCVRESRRDVDAREKMTDARWVGDRGVPSRDDATTGLVLYGTATDGY